MKCKDELVREIVISHLAKLYERPSAHSTRNVTPQNLCRFIEDIQRKRDLPEFRSYLGAEVLKILR